MNTYNYETEIPEELLEDITEEEREKESIDRTSFSYWQISWRRFRKDKLAMGGLVVIIVMTLCAVIGPMLSPYDYDQTDFIAILQGPSAKHWFGTDLLGRDVFVRTLYGARISLSIGFVAAAINMVIGVLYGGIAGYLGGWVDMIMMRIVDVLSGIPSLIYLILIMMFMGSSIQSILLAMCLTYWITTARMVRGQIFTLREQDYALAGKVCGQSKWQILTQHLIPNSMGSIIVTVTFLIPSAIFEEAFLSFLGIGIQVPMASWGTMCNDAIQYLTQQPCLMLFPALAISITIFALNFIGDGLRDALDPRINKQ
ncbi:MAG: ABC transporter permease [Lachnospiraceae bacterium]|nr:ABC transporter permease [Lachnospiraceae bacterium]